MKKAILSWLAVLVPVSTPNDETPLPQPWPYAAAMQTIARNSSGRPGVVIHVGDSITYSNPYGQWARAGQGQTPRETAVLEWMHTGKDDDTDGWWLARFDHPDGGRSYTACGGIRINEMLAGGKQNMPPLRALLKSYRPQCVVLMLGTNDASAGRPLADYRADMERAVDVILKEGVVCILSTIPPHPGQSKLAASYNEALRALAKSRSLPLIDYEREILKRRPNDWDGTLLNKGDVHPTANQGGATSASAPTSEHLRNSGYLLRGWLTVQKVAEVKEQVFDKLAGSDPAPRARRASRTSGRTVRVPVTRDNWFSDVGPEGDGNNGGAARLKVKSIQEMSVIDIDPKPLRGRVIADATLHVKIDGPERLRRITVGTFGADWVEGSGNSYTPQAGSSTFHHRRHPDVPWTVKGSDLCSVILGQGGTFWRMADATDPDNQGWQTVPVEPSVVAARVAGLSEGFFLFDDTGTEWTRNGERFEMRHYPNRFVFSKDSNAASAPYFTLVLGADDRSAPAAPSEVRSEPDTLPAGETWVTWTTPRDQGPAGTLGFVAEVNGKPLPRYLVPLAAKPGEQVRMHLRDQDLEGKSDARIAIRAVDAAGNLSRPANATVPLSTRAPAPLPPERPALAEKATGPLPKLGVTDVAVLDELDKVQPVTGSMVPAQPEGYLASNHIWDARAARVSLHTAKNEFVGFQILLRGADGERVRPTLHFEDGGSTGIKAMFGRYHHVVTGQGPLPDPIVPLDVASKLPDSVKDRKTTSLYCELYVAPGTRAGTHSGKLVLQAPNHALTLDVSLEVWDFTLPDFLSFLPEMNCYGLPESSERDYYRVAHRHRTYINRVPYHHNGRIDDGCAPKWNGRSLDWASWDARFGPYFDGSAFADLPRKRVPIEGFYLPIFENWPDPMEGHYNGNYWADRAFPERYRRDFVEVSRQFAAHLNQHGWNETFFQFFLNGKNDFKAGGWSRATSPWLLDEPANTQDYWALRYFGLAFHEGIHKAPGRAKLVFRADISRPQWQRDLFDGLLDFNVVGGAMRPYLRMVMDRKAADGQVVVEYGSSNAIEDSNMQPVGWAIDSWSLGSDGILPWQTIGSDESWTKADTLSLFYPARGGREPVPSIRLKAYRRGQQDVEYLTLWSQVKGEPRWAVGQRVREALGLAGERRGTGATGEDAGVIQFAKLRPRDVWALRLRIGEALSKAHPQPKRKLVELRTPPRDPAKVSKAYEVTDVTP
jgi:hypothetical protein